MSDRTPETPAPTLAEAARAVLGLWDVSDTRPAAPSRIAAGYEALRAALAAHEAAGAARLAAAVRAPARPSRLAAEVCRLQDEVEQLRAALRTITCAFCGETMPRDPVETVNVRMAQHIVGCQRHPLRAAVLEVERLRGGLEVLRQNAQWVKDRAALLDPGGPWHKELAEIERGCAALREAP